MHGRNLGVSSAVIAAAVLIAMPAASAARPRSELVVTRLSDPPALLAPGAELAISDRVANLRKRAKRSRNGYFLSSDKFRDLSDVELIGSRRVPRLKRRDASRGTAELTVPTGTASGDYRLLACADASERVREQSESNNCKATRGRVTIARNATPAPEQPGPPSDATPPGTPMIAATDPESPANDAQPEVTGTAEAGSTVLIYSTADCSGSPIGTGTAEAFGAGGITANVPEDATTQLRATATDAAGNVSGCSAPFPYTEDSTPPPAPTIDETNPASPANDPTPAVIGDAVAGSTVEIYASVNCSGPAIASDSAETFGGAGIVVTVPEGQTTDLSATATDAAGNPSPCSNSIPYEELNP